MQTSSESRETRLRARELKFLLRREMVPEVRAWTLRHLRPDVHGGGDSRDEYWITSLYCDTPHRDVFHRRGSFGRAKYRVRRYGTSFEVFLERKLRTNSLLAKRRTLVPLSSLAQLGPAPADERWNGLWFRERVLARNLSPSCQVSYRRLARVGSVPSGLMRLTLDDDLRVAPVTGFQFTDVRGDLLLTQHVIIELKFSGELPPLFHLFLDRFQLAAAPVSKYRLALGALCDLPVSLNPVGNAAVTTGGASSRDTLLGPCSPAGDGAPATDALVLS